MINNKKAISNRQIAHYMNIENPITIKRNRRKKFTEKKNPYKDYLNAKWKWSNIFSELDDLNSNNVHNYIRITAKKYNINYNTLKNKYNKYKNNININIDKENRGGCNKKITLEQEKDLYFNIKKNYIDKEYVLNNNTGGMVKFIPIIYHKYFICSLLKITLK
jgi:hypothetical protein